MVISVYHMMYTHFSMASMNELQRLYKDFLWGFTLMGTRKTPLVSWKWMARLRSHGGLGIRRIPKVGISLLARWASQLVSNSPSEWVALFRALLIELPRDHQRQLRRLGYTLTDKLLSCRPKSFRSCKYLEGLWRAWESLRKFLVFKMDGTLIPNRWTIKDLLSTIPTFRELPLHHQWRVDYLWAARN